jgi:hypothetical protein
MAYLPHYHAGETELSIRLYFNSHGVWVRHPCATTGIGFLQKLRVQGHLFPVVAMFDLPPRFFSRTVERQPGG